MIGTIWPKWEGGPSLEQHARQQLAYGDTAPFDDALSGEQAFNCDGNPVTLDQDWAVRAARGIIANFEDRGASFNEAFHPEKINHETRLEIVEVMAAVIREALKQA